MKSPSEKQIKFADYIANALKIDFPTCSRDFTAQNYFLFIQKYKEDVLFEPDVDDLYGICENDIWGEYY